MEIVQDSINSINQICKEVEYENYSVVVVSEVNEEFEGHSQLLFLKII